MAHFVIVVLFSPGFISENNSNSQESIYFSLTGKAAFMPMPMQA